MVSKKRFLKNLAAAERELSDTYEDLSLFAACFREDALFNHWDLVVAASWLLPETQNSYSIVIDSLRRSLEKDEFFSLDALPLLDPDDPRIQEIQDEYEVEHGLIDLGQCQLFDMDMERVYLITAKRRAAPVSKEVV